MRIVLLTTDTPHHVYYAWKLREQFPLAAILLETRSASAAFETCHPFEKRRDAYERERLLAGLHSGFQELADTRPVETVNSSESLSALTAVRPDVIIVFGTGKLSPAVIRIPVMACLNLHGGNPEQYRGLDSHLWTIYHRDFDNLVTTLHHVDAGLDTGDIVSQESLKLTRDTQLHELRSVNTEVCLHLSKCALSCLQSTGRLASRKQLQRGRYYSAMPAVLKEDCLRKLQQHVAAL